MACIASGLWKYSFQIITVVYSKPHCIWSPCYMQWGFIILAVVSSGLTAWKVVFNTDNIKLEMYINHSWLTNRSISKLQALLLTACSVCSFFVSRICLLFKANKVTFTSTQVFITVYEQLSLYTFTNQSQPNKYIQMWYANHVAGCNVDQENE